MPPSQIAVHRLDLIERELLKALSEFPEESALDRIKFVRALVRVMRSPVDLDEEATIPILDVEFHGEYPRR